MGKKADLTSKRFGRLTVLYEFGKNIHNKITWMCLCDCGNGKIASTGHLKHGFIKSCGCLHPELLKKRRTTHGKSKTPEYRIWSDMKRRCYNHKRQYYSIYGGRGIRVCESWHKFENFFKDMGPRPSKIHSIERKDPNGNYEPNNCVWAISAVQARNTRNRKDNKSGIPGVHWHKVNKKYTAYIAVNSKNIHLGSFLTIEEATEARKNAELRYWGEIKHDDHQI